MIEIIKIGICPIVSKNQDLSQDIEKQHEDSKLKELDRLLKV